MSGKTIDLRVGGNTLMFVRRKRSSLGKPLSKLSEDCMEAMPWPCGTDKIMSQQIELSRRIPWAFHEEPVD